ncbi:MAG TPA: hypothetical protein VD838_09505 [Anaeromyxobacteraceae bacterium]|nr:hypothetical protein [Anaeromyxobacteraceae bacterium]
MSFVARRGSLVIAAALAAAAACGDDGDGGDAAGAPADTTPETANVVAVPDTPELSFTAASAIHGVGPDHTTVLLSDAPGLCAALGGGEGACTAHGLPGLSRFLRIDVAGTPPGTYSGAEVVAVAIAPGEIGVSAGAGRVELAAETADGRLSGTYDLGIVGTGTFTTERCDALGGGDVDAGGTSRACSTSVQVNGDSITFDETCDCDGESWSRACERDAADAEWTCRCTGPSGDEATCTAAAEEGVVTAPENCCP